MRNQASNDDDLDAPVDYACPANIETILQLVLVPLTIVAFMLLTVGFIFLSE